MNSKVKVTADEAGAVVMISKKNPEYGYIRLAQTRIIFDKKGWAKKRNFSALVHGTVEELQDMNFFVGQELEGTIVVIEQLEPFRDEEPEKDYKIAGDTKIVCCIDGEPIYRQTIYLSDPNAVDDLLKHTNGEDIKTAYLELSEDKLDKAIQDKKSKLASVSEEVNLEV